MHKKIDDSYIFNDRLTLRYARLARPIEFRAKQQTHGRERKRALNEFDNNITGSRRLPSSIQGERQMYLSRARTQVLLLPPIDIADSSENVYS